MYEQQGQPTPIIQQFLGLSGEQLQALVAGIVGNLPQGPATPNPAAPEHRQRLRLRDPDPFAGDRTLYRTWKSQMERYLAVHTQATPNELIAVILSFIRGPNVDEWVNAYTDQHFNSETRLWEKTLKQVWKDLDLAYTDRVGEHSALQRMRDLRQKEGHAAEFFQEYEKLIWLAGMEEDDRMVLEYMKDAICDRFRQAIHNQINMPTTYEGWKKAVNQLDDNYLREQAIIQSRKSRAPQQGPPHRNAHPPRGPPIPTGAPIWNAGNATGSNAARADGTGVTYGGLGQPMEIDRTRTGQCWRCGGRRGQPAPGCQNGWHRPPAQLQRAPAPVPAPAPAPTQRFRGMTSEELAEMMRAWATEEPESFRRAGFGSGPA
ncbi:hypothetical protein C2E23DRAFT_907655 [Lenzites betulinus]|nr:hypothetical protein C2E23DRAFT_907655 [Lenzites betulinus]